MIAIRSALNLLVCNTQPSGRPIAAGKNTARYTSAYRLIFDLYGAEVLMNRFKMGEDSAKNSKKSTMVVESNITYNQEVKEGDEVDVNLLFFDHDKKRLQYKLEMIHKEKKYVTSTIETLSLYVDLNLRKVAEFEDEKIKIMDQFIKENLSKFNSENLKFSDKLKK